MAQVVHGGGERRRLFRDEGKGIDAKDLPYIFDRFYRSTTAVKHTKGAGLGLYLARAIVEAHGGRIWAENRSGGGAAFRFTLPVDSTLRSSPSPTAPVVDGGRSNFK